VRTRDYVIPLALLGAVAAFIIVQAIDVRDSRPPRPLAVAGDTTAAVASSGVSQEKAKDSVALQAVDSAALASLPASGLVTLRQSAEPPPARDAAREGELLREGGPGTYILELMSAQNNFLMRWPSRRSAVRVWIERQPSLPDWDAAYPVAAERAFAEWQAAGFPLRFDMIRDQGNTDIEIRWIEKFPAADGGKIGVARMTRDQHGWVVAAEITIATHNSDGKPLPPETVYGTARHEVGHALGLGHSPSNADVMFPESLTPAISEADRKTLRLLYMLPPGRIR